MILFTALIIAAVLLVERAARRKNARNHVRKLAVAASRKIHGRGKFPNSAFGAYRKL
jgi:hypothetical protein